MDLTKAKEVSDLLSDIDELSEYKKILEDREHGRVSHFEFCQHYGASPRKVVFEHKYTLRFLPVVEKILEELHEGLKSI